MTYLPAKKKKVVVSRRGRVVDPVQMTEGKLREIGAQLHTAVHLQDPVVRVVVIRPVR